MVGMIVLVKLSKRIKQFATILLMVVVLSGECRIRGGEERVHGEGRLHGVEANPQRKTVKTKSHHLFHNVAKALSDMIRDVFINTHLKNVSKCYALEKEFVVVDTTANNKDVTDHFPIMVKNYIEYKADLRLTRDRASMSVDAKQVKGPDAKDSKWSKALKELRKMVFDLINEAMEMVRTMPKSKHTRTERQRQQQKVNQHQNSIVKLMKNIKTRINQTINQKEYVNQEAKTAYTIDQKNANRIPEMEAIEAHLQQALRKLVKRARLWAIEAANFYIKKLNNKLK